MTRTTDRWTTWMERLEGTIRQDLMKLQVSRQYFEGLVRLSQAAGDEPSSRHSFVNWAVQGHVHIVATGIRRQAELRRDVVSLAGLLDDMARHPREFNWQRYSEQVPDGFSKGHRRSQFDEISLGATDLLDPGVPAAHLDRLIELARPIRRFVNKSVAHLDDKRELPDLSFEQLHRPLDFALYLLHVYTGHLTYHDFVVKVTTEDWPDAFATPWVSPSALPLLFEDDHLGRAVIERGRSLEKTTVAHDAYRPIVDSNG